MIKRAFKVGTAKVKSPQCSIRLRVKVVTDNNPAVVQFVLVFLPLVYFSYIKHRYFGLGMDGFRCEGEFKKLSCLSVFVFQAKGLRGKTQGGNYCSIQGPRTTPQVF